MASGNQKFCSDWKSLRIPKSAATHHPHKSGFRVQVRLGRYHHCLLFTESTVVSFAGVLPDMLLDTPMPKVMGFFLLLHSESS